MGDTNVTCFYILGLQSNLRDSADTVTHPRRLAPTTSNSCVELLQSTSLYKLYLHSTLCTQ
jgi:hypothetical protein